jgi:hypothetical protein
MAFSAPAFLVEALTERGVEGDKDCARASRRPRAGSSVSEPIPHHTRDMFSRLVPIGHAVAYRARTRCLPPAIHVDDTCVDGYEPERMK